MYLTRADSWPGRVGQGLVQLSGLRFMAPARLEQEAQRAGFGLERAQYRVPVALALFQRTPL